MKSLLLDTVAWDLVLDANGDEAVATRPYSIFQDVAIAAVTQKDDIWYDTEMGVPYYSNILGKRNNPAVIVEHIIRETSRVPGVDSVRAFSNFDTNTRKSTCTLQVVTEGGDSNEIIIG